MAVGTQVRRPNDATTSIPAPAPPAFGIDALETATVVAVISVVVTLALGYYQVALVKSASSEALSVTQTLRRELFEFRARHGRWPRSEEVVVPRRNASDAGSPPPASDVSANVATIEVGESGELTVTFNAGMPALAGHRLTLRPVVVPGQADAPVRWTCGKRIPAPPAVALGADRTDLPDELLMHLCRNGVEP